VFQNETPPLALIHQAKNAASNGRQGAQRQGSSRLRKGLVAAAACVFIVAGSITAFATNLFGLRDLVLPGGEQSDQMISLQGFMGSAEHNAAAEWKSFLDAYDVEAALEAAGNDWGDVPEAYRMYGAYDLEMTGKIDEIAGKYGLSLFGEFFARTQEELQASIADGPLFTDASIWFEGYQFESGTFQFDAGYGDLMFQFRSSRKGVFDNVFLPVGDAAEYAEWNYENAHGTPLLLMQSGHKSLILLETDAAFIVVNVLAGNDGLGWGGTAFPFDSGKLERLADLIEFAQLK